MLNVCFMSGASQHRCEIDFIFICYGLTGMLNDLL